MRKIQFKYFQVHIDECELAQNLYKQTDRQRETHIWAAHTHVHSIIMKAKSLFISFENAKLAATE